MFSIQTQFLNLKTHHSQYSPIVFLNAVSPACKGKFFSLRRRVMTFNQLYTATLLTNC